MPAPSPRTRKLITIGEAAAYCRVNPKTIRRWIIAGRLTGYRTGPVLVRVDQAELDASIKPISAAG